MTSEKIQVTIARKIYEVSCPPEKAAELRAVAKYFAEEVENYCDESQSNLSRFSSEGIVITALNLLYRSLKKDQQFYTKTKQIKERISEIDNLLNAACETIY